MIITSCCGCHEKSSELDRVSQADIFLRWITFHISNSITKRNHNSYHSDLNFFVSGGCADKLITTSHILDFFLIFLCATITSKNKVQTESQLVLMSSQLWMKWKYFIFFLFFFFLSHNASSEEVVKLHYKQSITEKKNIQDFLKAPSANTDVFTYTINLKCKSFFLISYSHSGFLLPAGGYASVALWTSSPKTMLCLWIIAKYLMWMLFNFIQEDCCPTVSHPRMTVPYFFTGDLSESTTPSWRVTTF